MSLEEVRDFYVPRCLAIAGSGGLTARRREDAPKLKATRKAPCPPVQPLERSPSQTRPSSRRSRLSRGAVAPLRLTELTPEQHGW